MNRKILSLAALLVLIISQASAADKPLALVSSDPESGSTGVALRPVIELVFSNNVVNLSVQEINAGAFALTSSSGEAVALKVIFPDDQLEPDLKRNITLETESDLRRATVYILTVDGSLQAKNGQKLGTPVSLSFTTAE